VLISLCIFVTITQVIAFPDMDLSDPLDATRRATAFDFVRVAVFGILRCIVCVLSVAGLQYLRISHYVCLKTLLFVFVSIANYFRRKTFLRYHTAGSMLGALGSALVCVSVALFIVHVDQPYPCASPHEPSPQNIGVMPLAFAMVCVGVSQALLAILYCLEETFLSRVKIETQFFMGLQGVFGCVFMCLCCVAVRSSPAFLSHDGSNLSALLKLGHEDVVKGFHDVALSTPLCICCIIIAASSCIAAVSCIITTQHATPSCRLAIELAKIIVVWALGVYSSTRSAEHLNWMLPAEAWSSQCVVVAIGLLISAIGQGVYHRCVAVGQFVPNTFGQYVFAYSHFAS
jgi:hypothetical protein